MLERLPACATTGVGSLPFADPREAVSQAYNAYDVPFCPQLPDRDGDMVAEWLGADPRRCGWSAERDRERPHCWDWFLRQVSEEPPSHGIVKLQVTGPLTLAVALEREGGVLPTAATALPLAAQIAAWLAATAAAQAATLADRGLSTLLVVDEPALAALAPPADGAARVWDPLRAAAPAWGLHACCAVPWDLVEHARPDVLSLDATRHPLDQRAAIALERLIDGGGRIAWGVVAVDRDEGPADAARRLAAAIAALGARGVGANRVLDHTLLTPACGTGRAAPAREHAVAAALAAAAGAGRAMRRPAPAIDSSLPASISHRQRISP